MAGSDEDEVFEIVDFTSASEWETFTSKLEEILLSWQLSGKDREEEAYEKVQLNGPWKEVSENISFAGYPFTLTHHWVEHDTVPSEVKDDKPSSSCQVFGALMDEKNDFPPSGCHSLAKFYGLSDFVILCPAGNEMLTTESRINLVLSSITMAISNIQSRVPVFVQVRDRSQQLFHGVFESKHFRTDFQMAHLRQIPSSGKHLSGLLEMFKEKTGSRSIDRTSVSICWTYSLMPHLDSADHWPQSPPDMDAPKGQELFGRLPFGATRDPVKEIRVSSIWNGLNEDIVVDSEVYTDLDPIQAPLWSVQLDLSGQVPSLLLKTLCGFMDNVARSSQSTEQLLGRNYTVLNSPESPEYERALGALTKSRSSSAYSILTSGSSSKRAASSSSSPPNAGPIPEESLVAVLNFLFPDAEGDPSSQTHPYPAADSLPADYPSALEDSGPWKDSFGAFKTSPVDSLVHRLATSALLAAQETGGAVGLAHLWHEIVLELRFRWEHGYAIPGLQTGMPDLNYCRLYQKLQMLNCCIKHKNSTSAGSAPPQEDPTEVTPGTEEDEFFDAQEEVTVSRSAWNQPQGRLERTKLKLLGSPDEWLYAPVTQDPLPMTEDMLDEQAEMMEQLGTDAEASELRARILSASLLSDMEAFKAANPGAVMEDFVRWHSPRDWIPDGADVEGLAGHLSGRMKAPGNLWQEMWKAAKPVVAWRQKRLFDDTKEAEKILHDFSSLRPSQVAALLLPAIFHAAAYRLLEELAGSSSELSDVKETCRALVARIGQISSMWPGDLTQYEDVLPLFQRAEVRLSQFKSLRRKLAGCRDADSFATRLMNEGNVLLPGGSHTPVGSVLLRALELSSGEGSSKTHQQTPVPIRKEFILRTTARRPGPGSEPSCQRMYCSVDKDSFRLAGAFTEDTLFF